MHINVYDNTANTATPGPNWIAYPQQPRPVLAVTLEELDDFEDIPCSKCHHSVINLNYCGGSSQFSSCGTHEHFFVNVEHMHHICARCSYERVTKTLDGKKYFLDKIVETE